MTENKKIKEVFVDVSVNFLDGSNIQMSNTSVSMYDGNLRLTNDIFDYLKLPFKTIDKFTLSFDQVDNTIVYEEEEKKEE